MTIPKLWTTATLATTLIIGVLMVGGVAVSDSKTPATAPTRADIQIADEDGRIKIDLADAPLGEAMAALSDASGVAVDIAPSLRQVPISATVDAPDWGAAMLEVLEDYETSIEWEDVDKGQPGRIWISSSRTTAGGDVSRTSADMQRESVTAASPPPPPLEGDPSTWAMEEPDPFVPPPLEGPIFTPAR